MGGAPCTALPGGLGLSSFLPGRLLNWIGLITSREERDLNTEELAKLERVKAALSENEAGLIEAEAKLESQRRMPSIPDENAAFARMAGVDNRNAGFIADKSKSGRPGKKYADLFGPDPAWRTRHSLNCERSAGSQTFTDPCIASVLCTSRSLRSRHPCRPASPASTALAGTGQLGQGRAGGTESSGSPLTGVRDMSRQLQPRTDRWYRHSVRVFSGFQGGTDSHIFRRICAEHPAAHSW